MNSTPLFTKRKPNLRKMNYPTVSQLVRDGPGIWTQVQLPHHPCIHDARLSPGSVSSILPLTPQCKCRLHNVRTISRSVFYIGEVPWMAFCARRFVSIQFLYGLKRRGLPLLSRAQHVQKSEASQGEPRRRGWWEQLTEGPCSSSSPLLVTFPLNPAATFFLWPTGDPNSHLSL